jgi:hypothetical protein
VKLATHLHLAHRSTIMELWLYSPKRLHGFELYLAQEQLQPITVAARRLPPLKH